LKEGSKRILIRKRLQYKKDNHGLVFKCADNSEPKIEEYQSVRDKHLQTHFLKKGVQKILQKTGVVDNNGHY